MFNLNSFTDEQAKEKKYIYRAASIAADGKLQLITVTGACIGSIEAASKEMITALHKHCWSRARPSHLSSCVQAKLMQKEISARKHGKANTPGHPGRRPRALWLILNKHKQVDFRAPEEDEEFGGQASGNSLQRVNTDVPAGHTRSLSHTHTHTFAHANSF